MIQIFRVFIPGSVLGLLVSEILLIFGLYLLPTWWLKGEEFELYLFYEDGLFRIVTVAGSVLAGLYFSDLYEQIRVARRTLLVQQVCLVMGIAFLVQGALAYISAEWRLPRDIMLAGSGGCLVLLPAWRILYNRLLLRAFGAERILFVGTSQTIQEVVARLNERPELGLQPIGFLAPDEQPLANPPACRPLGEVAKVRDVIAAIHPDRVVIGLAERRQQLPVYDLLDLSLSGVRIEETAGIYEVAFSRVCLRELRPSQLIFGGWGPRRRSLVLQGMVAFFAALVGLVLVSPLMLLAALAVRLSSPGPVLFRQTRVGKNGRHFTVYKFRSMYADAEARTGAVWAQKDDPRVTPVGRWLRRLRIDELPQLVNVLKGDMALVGPRPERPEFVQLLSERIPFYNQRHCVRPGVTGWAQINFRYGNTFEDTATKLEYDLYYIKNLSLALDLYIMFHTVKIMLLTRGAQ
ncbi:MAG: sugar transferase [Bryobacteraceae bacterium]|nr:sugar transferase [Bryobacteraceae bacterium]